MANELTNARSKLNKVNRLLKEQKLLAAATSIHEALGTYRRTQLLKHEKQDFQRLLEQAIFQFSSEKQIKQMFPFQLQYEEGKEKELSENFQSIIEELQQKATEEAQKSYEAIQKKKEQGLNKGQEHLQNQDLDKARQVFNALANEFPDDTELKVSIGDTFLQFEQYNDAIDYLQDAYKDNPNSVHIFNRLGMALRKARRFEEAERCYLQALGQGHDEEYIYFNLGRVYIDWKKWDQVEKVAQKAIHINPEFNEAQKMLNFAQKKLN